MFKLSLAAVTAATLLASASAGADTQTASQLANANAVSPIGTVSTTTDASGRRTTANSSFGFRYSDAAAPKDVWQQQNIGGGATVGITNDYTRSGNGAAFFEGTGSSAKADLEIYFTQAIPLSSLTGASYDVFRDASSTAAAHLTNSLRLIIGDAAGSSASSYLIFEPVYNSNPVANPINENQWYTFDITGASTFFSNNGNFNEPAGTGACAGCYASLSAWQAANPTLTIIGLSTGIGSGWSGTYRGAVDNVSFTAGGVTRTTNFEVTAAVEAAVPEPATWAMMIAGFGLVGATMRRRRFTVRAQLV